MGDQSTISNLPEGLSGMTRSQLAQLWEEQFGNSPIPGLRSELMRPVLAFRIQEKAHGLSSRNLPPALASDSKRLKAGTRIVREWKGKLHEVAVTKDGYEYDRMAYKSLSSIATHITGTKWSGPAFFGTKSTRRGK
jgi:hypothetical protein